MWLVFIKIYTKNTTIKNGELQFMMTHYLNFITDLQAGLSWITILNKRENFRAAFDQFDYKK
jgi:hypothetical protein